jgi:enhancing lycopene biosynthesis protein 2
MAKKIAVVLAGAGVYDGSEVHEATLTLLYLDRHETDITCFAPDKPQMHVINHHAGEEMEGESRNVRVEAARIARGEVKPMGELKAADFDALVIPGGFGAAKNLCDFAVKGADCTVDPDLEAALLDFYEAKKPIAPMCIAPAAVAKTFGKKGVKVQLTIGTDADTGDAIRAMGAEHVNANVDEIVVDSEHKIISTPAYMLGPSIAHVDKGISKLVDEVLDMA